MSTINPIRVRFKKDHVSFDETYVQFSEVNYFLDSDLTLTEIDNFTVDIFKTSGSNAWGTQAYSLTPFSAPCTIEFNKQAEVVIMVFHMQWFLGMKIQQQMQVIQLWTMPLFLIKLMPMLYTIMDLWF